MERFRRPRQAEDREKPSGLVRAIGGRLGEYADPTLKDLVEYYKRDEYVGYSVESFATRTAGMGFFLTGDQPRALRLIDQLARANGLYLRLHWKIARDLWLAGNAFVNTVPADKITSLHYLPLSSFQQILRDEGGEVETYVQLWGGVRKMLSPEEVLHYTWNRVDEDAFGEGLVNRLARPGKGYLTEKGKSRKRPPHLQIREKMVDNAHRILARYQPRHVYRNVPSAKLDDFVALLDQLEPEQDFAADFDLQVDEAKMDPRTRFEGLLDILDRMSVVGFQSPQLRLITLAGFTFASSQAAMETIEPEVRMMQEYIKETDEALFRKVIEQHGGSPERANVELHWGVPDRPEFLVADIIAAYQAGLQWGAPMIDRDEAREMLKEVGWFIKSKPEEEGIEAQAQGKAEHFVCFKHRIFAVSDTLYNFLREVREPPALIKAPKTSLSTQLIPQLSGGGGDRRLTDAKLRVLKLMEERLK